MRNNVYAAKFYFSEFLREFLFLTYLIVTIEYFFILVLVISIFI
jgi:hypothetical protein